MSSITDIGIPGVGNGILHPKLKNKWRVTFAGIGGGVNSRDLSMQIVTMTRPVLTFEEVELNRYNSKAWVAGKHTFEEMTMTAEDDVTGTASRVIQDQVQAQQWLIGAEGPWLATRGEGSLYKFVTTLDMLDGNEQVIEQWFMEGCWLKSVDYTDLAYADSTAVQITMSMRYDHARQLIGGYDQGEGIALGGPANANKVPGVNQ